MAFDGKNNQRKPLLFSELFKTPGNTSAPEPSKLEGSSCSSSSTQFLSSYDSSSSGFSTPLYSDLESEDSDFISELTRQMAECMLQETDEEEEEKENTVVDSVSVVKNEPPVRKKGPFCRGKRVKGTESAQQKRIKKTELQYAGRANGYSGSGMHAVFLGGSTPRIGHPGTGVFLPRDPSELRNKTGRSCSTVLIPTRVLQVLEGLHLGKIQDSTSTTPLGGGAASTSPKDKLPISNGGWEECSGPTENDEMQLPQEWTY